VLSDTAQLGGRSDTASRGSRLGGHTTAPGAVPVAAPIQINVARARDALDDLFIERLDTTTAAMVRDSAFKFYQATGISGKDKAYAAFVVGQAYFNLKDRSTGCRYIREANDIDPADRTYATLASEQCN
jgi:hypothetical protein